MKYSIAPSALAYLFGDLLEEVFAEKTRLASGVKIPCREKKVKKPDLASVMLTAAFVHLAEKNFLKLTTGAKGLILKSKTVFATLSPERSAQSFDHFEGDIVTNITGNERKDDISSIVQRLLERSTRDPRAQLIQETHEYLLGQGYFTKEERGGIARLLGKKTVPQCEKIAKLEGEARQLKETMAAFRSSQPEIYKLLWKAVASGIRSREMRDDY